MMEKITQNLPEGEKNKERIREIIERFDFAMLQSILEEVLRKSEADPEKAHKISPDIFEMFKNKNFLARIYNKYLNKTAAGYGQGQDKIYLNSEQLVQFEDDTIVLLIIHETLHSVSDMFIKETYGARYEERVGLDSDTLKLGGPLIVKRVIENKLLNEGLTQLLAEAVQDEYFRRQGEKTTSFEKFDSFYPISKVLVEILVKSIAFKTNIPEDVVFKALVRCVLNYDYTEFYEMAKEEKDLLELLDKIKKPSSERQLMNINWLKKTAAVHLSRFRVDGLGHIIDEIVDKKQYYNPLYGKLNEK